MKAHSEALSSFNSVLHLCGGIETDEIWGGEEKGEKEKEKEVNPLSFYHPIIITHRTKAHYRMGMVCLSLENFENARHHLSLSLSLSCGEDQNAKNGLVKVAAEEEKKKKREKKLYSNMFG